MDSSDGHFKASFFGIGDKGQEIGRYLDIEFNDLINYFQKYIEDDPSFYLKNEFPQLNVISLNEKTDESVKELPYQEIIFLLGSQYDQFFWEIRSKIIDLNKHYFLFTFVLSQQGAFNNDIQANRKESQIYLGEGAEKQVVTFVKDMCRFRMFPNLISCDISCIRTVLSNNRGKLISYENLHNDHIEPFQQLIADKGELLKRATGLVFLVSSSLGDSFTFENHYQPIISIIEEATSGDCNIIGSDSLYAETKSPLRVNMLCVEN